MLKALLKTLPLKVLIGLVFDLLKYIASKTKNTTDDQIVQALWDMYVILEPIVPERAKQQYKKLQVK